ncbi:MAG: hypothetical protein IT282_10210 [Bacteroidetes bacterium]|nr:hypothetical protein [Bacteroidota bacterium]
MGSQQLLLLIVGVLMVGLMISVGIIMFGDNASASNRDAVASELATYASKAQVYYRKPRCLGGGGGSFQGFSLGAPSVSNLNGVFTISSNTPSQATIEGVGVERGFDQVNPVKVAVDVRPDSIFTTELN